MEVNKACPLASLRVRFAPQNCPIGYAICIIDEAEAKEIILSLTVMDFSEILQNEHKGYEHEKLYVFGKDVTLLERNGTEEKQYLCISSSISWRTVL